MTGSAARPRETKVNPFSILGDPRFYTVRDTVYSADPKQRGVGVQEVPTGDQSGGVGLGWRARARLQWDANL